MNISDGKTMKFKEVSDLRISVHPSRYAGRWNSDRIDFSKITIFIHHLKYCDNIETICDFITDTFLTEYICSCVMRGNSWKKECTDRKFKNKQLIGCIPNYLVKNIISKLLHKQKVRHLRRQKRITQFLFQSPDHTDPDEINK